MDIKPYLKLMIKQKASDLYCSSGTQVHLRVDGRTIPVGDQPIGSEAAKEMIYALLSPEQILEFEDEWELNIGLPVEGVGRFRLNVFQQRGSPAMVIRHIKSIIPNIDNTGLPPILKELIMEPRGLILIVGATGSGKSTTLATMLEYRNQNRSGHILTIEDPVEFLFEHKKSIVNQREIGLDTQSFHMALKNAMREAPDVIMIGEIRDQATMQAAISYAETGHLCISTLHANNANQALDRIKNFFPETAHQQLRSDLSQNLKGVISQRLLPASNGGRIPAVEVMLLSSYVSELILGGDTRGIKEAMENSDTRGMQTFDQCLFKLYTTGKISLENALNNADSRNDLALRIRLSGSGS
ncbi:twitching motility protein PilT [Achromatium sp. WMS3]|nr:twitching motility protein PilT [Achromatium sp. WMS3]